jgi:hypothetical protein
MSYWRPPVARAKPFLPLKVDSSFGYSIQQWVNTKATVDHVTVSYVERVPDYGMLSDQEQEVEANLEGTLGRRTAQKEQTQTRIKREDPDTGVSCIAKMYTIGTADSL